MRADMRGTSVLTIELKARFVGLAARLSPENLTCDGELSRSQAKARLSVIRREWAELEKQAGRKVTEDEPWDWSGEVAAHDRAKVELAKAAEPSHPLLEHRNLGVWCRMGGNGMSAYYVWGPSHTGEPGYVLWSEFAHLLFRRERLRSFDSLDEAAAAGEIFLRGITPDRMRHYLPNYRPENIARELKRLPLEHYERLDLAELA